MLLIKENYLMKKELLRTKCSHRGKCLGRIKQKNSDSHKTMYNLILYVNVKVFCLWKNQNHFCLWHHCTGVPIRHSKPALVVPEIEDLNSTETQTKGFTKRGTEALDARSPVPLHERTVDRKHAEIGSVTPDMVEGQTCKAASPAQSEARTAHSRQEHIAAVPTSREAFVRKLPHAVARVGAIWFRQDLLKLHLTRWL